MTHQSQNPDRREEILKRNTEAAARCKVEYNITHDAVLQSMSEYADLISQAKEERIKELEIRLIESNKVFETLSEKQSDLVVCELIENHISWNRAAISDYRKEEGE